MLTDAGIKALRPCDKIYKVVDRDGMYVAVQPSGSVIFRYDYRINGRRETLTLGRYGPAGYPWRERAKSSSMPDGRSRKGVLPLTKNSVRSDASRRQKASENSESAG